MGAAGDPRARPADRPRPRPRDRGGEPEGRRRQDDVDDQPRRGARRVRPPGAARRLRPAGRAVGRPRRAAAPARPHRLQPAHGARRRDRRGASARPASRAWTCCPATSTCPRPRSSWSSRSGASRRSGRALKPVLDRYDIVLIDCQPSLGLLTINALACADSVLIPLECEFFSLRGVALLMDTIDKVRDRLNPNLDILGILATMYDPRTLHTREVQHRVRRGVRRPRVPGRDQPDGAVPGDDRRRRADHDLGAGVGGRGGVPPAGPRGPRPVTLRRRTSPPLREAVTEGPRRGSPCASNNFTGPFDLLLQLIGKHQLDVTELALHRVTDDFIAHLTALGDDTDLDETTEFLVIAATLLDLKAARLLPDAEVTRTATTGPARGPRPAVRPAAAVPRLQAGRGAVRRAGGHARCAASRARSRWRSGSPGCCPRCCWASTRRGSPTSPPPCCGPSRRRRSAWTTCTRRRLGRRARRDPARAAGRAGRGDVRGADRRLREPAGGRRPVHGACWSCSARRRSRWTSPSASAS